MRNVFLLTFLAIGFIACEKNDNNGQSAQKITQPSQKNDLKEDNLKGNVMSIQEDSYIATEKFGTLQKEKRFFNYGYKIYDRKGNMVEWASYKPDGSFEFKNSYKYNTAGKHIETERQSPDRSTNSKFIYDEKGRLIEENTYDSLGKLMSKSTHRYDEMGNNELHNYDENGNLIYKIFIKYDANGNIIESTIYTPNGIIKSKDTQKFDKDNNIIEINFYNSDGNLRAKRTRKYDEKGNMIEDIIYEGGTIKESYFYKYDNMGNVVEDMRGGVYQSFYTYEYKYDSNGNWIQKLEKVADKVIITERKITYY